MISVSIVSHNHQHYIPFLLKQLHHLELVKEIIITLNLKESIDLSPYQEKIKIIYNEVPKGFASNHNYAFQYCTQPFFCVLNPDIKLLNDPFEELIKTIDDLQAALIVPQIISQNGEDEDNIRSFPSIYSLFKKLLYGARCVYPTYPNQINAFPDWVAGMFMLFRSSDFSAIHGFDDHFFLYYEDVDICARLRKCNKTIVANLNTKAIHYAQRSSHRNLCYMRWHIFSMLRYFWVHRDL